MARSLAETVGKELIGISGLPPMEDESDGTVAPSIDMQQARFIHSLIKHLDMLYSRMLADDVSEMSQPVNYIAGRPYVQTRSWHNPGHSSVTESA